MQIDRKSRKPIYRQIYDCLREEIIKGVYKDSMFLPSERELCERFGVERITARKSLSILVNDGMVEKVAGRGSRIIYNGIDEDRENSRNILFILPDSKFTFERITESFNAQLFYRVEAELRKNGYHTIYTTIHSDESLSSIINAVNVRGIIFVSNILDKFLKEAAAIQIPAVSIKRTVENMISIVIDDVEGGYLATKYLIGKGHKKIAVITGGEDFETSQNRMAGYMRALVDEGLDIDRSLLLEGDWTYTGGYNAADRLINSGIEMPTAIFAFNDVSACGAIRRLKKHGFTIPDDISIVGFDNVEQCVYTSPELTTIDVNIKTMAGVAVYHLESILNSDKQMGFKVVVPTNLIERDSVADV